MSVATNNPPPALEPDKIDSLLGVEPEKKPEAPPVETKPVEEKPEPKAEEKPAVEAKPIEPTASDKLTEKLDTLIDEMRAKTNKTPEEKAALTSAQKLKGKFDAFKAGKTGEWQYDNNDDYGDLNLLAESFLESQEQLESERKRNDVLEARVRRIESESLWQKQEAKYPNLTREKMSEIYDQCIKDAAETLGHSLAEGPSREVLRLADRDFNTRASGQNTKAEAGESDTKKTEKKPTIVKNAAKVTEPRTTAGESETNMHPSLNGIMTPQQQADWIRNAQALEVQ